LRPRTDRRVRVAPDNDVGDIVRIGRGTWGLARLAEWYPNRNFKKKTKGEGETEIRDEDETSEPEQPSKPTLVAATG